MMDGPSSRLRILGIIRVTDSVFQIYEVNDYGDAVIAAILHSIWRLAEHGCGRMAFPAIWRVTMGAALCASVFSYLFLLGALISDRSKAPDSLSASKSIPEQADGVLAHLLDSLNSDALERKEALFSLVNDNEWRITATKRREKRALSDNIDTDDMGCEEIGQLIPGMDFLAAGWTKAVYTARTSDNRTVAVKMVDPTGQDVGRCVEQRRRARSAGDHADWCYQRAVKKLIKEIVVLKLLLEHPNVVKILGYCVPKTIDSRSSALRVSLVTELGEPVNLIRLLQMSWEDRLRIVLAVARLTDYLSEHPSGSLVLNDMRREQFIVSSDGELKLVDVDDIGLEEPSCDTDHDCQRYLTDTLGFENSTVTLTCGANKVCAGANELRNIYNAARHFTTFLLPYGAPHRLQSDSDQLVEAFRYLRLPAHQLKKRTEALVDSYAAGSYLADKHNDTTARDFVVWPDSDLPGQFDYPCESSFSQIGCSLSVADLAEARQLCAAQRACRAFVWVNDKTWTGRTVVHFKNDVRSPSRRPGAKLYVKVVD